MRNFITALFEIAMAFEVVITVIYWGFLFNGFVDSFTLYLDLNGHGFPILALAIDFILNSYEFYIRRYLFLLMLAVPYLVINLSYALLNTPVYGILTWVDWLSYVLGLAALVMALVAYTIGLVAYNVCCKEKLLSEKIKNDRDQIYERDANYFDEKNNQDGKVQELDSGINIYTIKKK